MYCTRERKCDHPDLSNQTFPGTAIRKGRRGFIFVNTLHERTVRKSCEACFAFR